MSSIFACKRKIQTPTPQAYARSQARFRPEHAPVHQRASEHWKLLTASLELILKIGLRLSLTFDEEPSTTVVAGNATFTW